MKKFLYAIASVLFLAGCSYLDMKVDEMNTLDKVFASRAETLKWFNRIYSDDYFPNELYGSQYYNHYMFANDDACNNLDWHIPPVVRGNISPANPTSGVEYYFFGLFYQAIRHCNIFLENVDRCTELGMVEKDRMIAEAHFMRAMYHWWIVRAYGPVPIIDHSIEPGAAGVKIPRNSMDECVEWICNEIDAAIPNMDIEKTAPTLGFPTQGAALAMKSRILLYAASPLYNGNSSYANWRNNDGKQLISQTYDNNKWKKAADAAKIVIDLGRYSLKRPVTSSFDDIVKNLREITTDWNDETIWPRPAATGWWFGSVMPAVYQGWNARNSVTLELVNDFFMADGSTAPSMESWFALRRWSSAPGDGTQANTFEMFVGREPRFYAATMFPNQRVTFAAPANPGVWQTLEFWYDGNCGVSKSSGDRNSTGFTMMKNIPLDAYSDKSLNLGDSRSVPFPVIRLAEIYLNYCEAMNEWGGASTHSQILPYLNEIRERAGIPGYSGTFNKEQMREMLRHERRIELVWEVHRFFDVRRWFIAHGENGVFNKPVHGLDVTRGSNAIDPSFFTMTVTDGARAFRMEHYFEPVKSAECAFNTELLQAPFY